MQRRDLLKAIALAPLAGLLPNVSLATTVATKDPLSGQPYLPALAIKTTSEVLNERLRGWRVIPIECADMWPSDFCGMCPDWEQTPWDYEGEDHYVEHKIKPAAHQLADWLVERFPTRTFCVAHHAASLNNTTKKPLIGRDEILVYWSSAVLGKIHYHSRLEKDVNKEGFWWNTRMSLVVFVRKPSFQEQVSDYLRLGRQIA